MGRILQKAFNTLIGSMHLEPQWNSVLSIHIWEWSGKKGIFHAYGQGMIQGGTMTIYQPIVWWPDTDPFYDGFNFLGIFSWTYFIFITYCISPVAEILKMQFHLHVYVIIILMTPNCILMILTLFQVMNRTVKGFILKVILLFLVIKEKGHQEH